MNMDPSPRSIVPPSVLLPSRRAPLAELQGADGPAPQFLLLTGEPGSGKTWLWRRLVESEAGRREWVAVDVSPSLDAAGLHRLIAAQLGWSVPAPGTEPAALLAASLVEAADDGRRLGLIVDEAQNAADAVLEEIRLLSNRLGRDDGFDRILVCGQTGLLRRLRSRPLMTLNGRFSRRIHLGPIDLDEARSLLRDDNPDAAWTEAVVAECHRWARGNPGKLIRLAPEFLPRSHRWSRPVDEAAPVAEIDADAVPVSALSAVNESPSLLPPKAPLVMNDGVIEVGWDPRQDVETGAESGIAGPRDPQEMAVDDPYAALQAWDEWTTNRHRTAEGGDADTPAGMAAAESGSGRVWSEDRQGFAPYSDLFAVSPSSGEPN